MAATANVSPALSSLLTFTVQPHTHKLTNSTHSPTFFKPLCSYNPNSTLQLPRLRSCCSKRAYKRLAVLGSIDNGSAANQDSESSDLNKGASINLKLPRRRMLVQFTCNECGERTQRLINRLAYERGLVYVQCAGCLRHHKLVDNLGIVVEYDLREETSLDQNTD